MDNEGIVILKFSFYIKFMSNKSIVAFADFLAVEVVFGIAVNGLEVKENIVSVKVIL